VSHTFIVYNPNPLAEAVLAVCSFHHAQGRNIPTHMRCYLAWQVRLVMVKGKSDTDMHAWRVSALNASLYMDV
jgi:hypothetical protein